MNAQLAPRRPESADTTSLGRIARSVLAVVLGALVWMIVFYALAFGLAALWPQYGVHGQRFFEEGVFTFTASMAVLNLVFWFVGEAAAGFVAMKIARRAAAVWALAALLAGYLALMHIALYWDRFPWWYNLAVVIPAVPAVLLGAALARRGGGGDAADGRR